MFGATVPLAALVVAAAVGYGQLMGAVRVVVESLWGREGDVGALPPEREVVDVQADPAPECEVDAVDESVVVELDCNAAGLVVGVELDADVDVETRGGKAGMKAFAPGLKEKLN